MRSFLVAGAVLLLVPMLASAQAASTTGATPTPAPAPAAGKGDPRDADRDGRISWPEYMMSMNANFERMDANKSGTLEGGEMPGIPAGKMLARAEFDSKLRPAFDNLDKDKDGFLAAAELPQRK
jgi:hypothetical protein